jgi:competence protein ComEC
MTGDPRTVAARVIDEILARPRHLVLGALVAGLLVAPVVSVGAALVLAGLVLVAGTRARRPGLAVALAAGLLAGVATADARLAAAERPSIAPFLQRPLTGRVVVLDPVRRRAFGGWSVAARLATGPAKGARLVLRGPGRVRLPALTVGDELLVRGRLVPLADWERNEAVRGARAAVALDAARPTGRARRGPAGALDGARRRAEQAVTNGLPPPQAALARGMVLGQDDALDEATRDEFRASGLSHLLAASGQNVALLALLATSGLALLGAGLRLRFAAALVLVALYVPLAGGGPSILRAGVMGGAALVAGLAGRPASRGYALLLAAAATIALNPRAPSDVGWQLSFAAVIAIAVLAPRWRAWLLRRRVPVAVAEALALTAAATVGTAPLLAVHFERLSVVSLPANLVAAPAVAPVVWLGTLSALAGQLGTAGGAVAAVLNGIAAFPLGFVGWVAHVAASAPHATLAVALGGPAAVMAAYIALGALVVSPIARGVAVGVLVAAASVAGWQRLHPPSPPRELTVSFLDVGQGDATLVQHGRRAILVDTGPPGGPVLDRLRAAGVRRLDLLVLTHAQLDHEGAAPAVLDRVPVGTVLDGGAGWHTAQRPAIEAALRRHVAARRIAPAAGQVLRVGPLRVDVLWPPAAAPGVAPTGDPNDRAVVARVSEGRFDVLLTADAESPVTLPLAHDAVDVLKVAHHGSADPGLPLLLGRLHPALAAIEVGRHNSYGHPNPVTLRELATVPRVVRTDRDGTVRVTVAAGRMTVRTHA